MMRTYEFIATLAEGTEHTDDLVEALFEAGCDDSKGRLAGRPNHDGGGIVGSVGQHVLTLVSCPSCAVP